MAAHLFTIVLEYNHASIVTRRPPTYAEALSKARTLFPSLPPNADIFLKTQISPLAQSWSQVVEDAWNTPMLSQDGRFFRVQVGKPILPVFVAAGIPVASTSGQKHPRPTEADAGPARKEARCSRSPEPAPSSRSRLESAAVTPIAPPHDFPPRCELTIRQIAPGMAPVDVVNVKVKRATPFSKVYTAVAERIGVDERSFRLLWEGQELEGYSNADLMEFDDAELIEIRLRQVGGKPVIYLFPPSALASVQVDLTLVPEWTFSALYPLSDIIRGKDGSSTTSWTVAAEPDGTLVDKASSLSLSYLFWEAHAPSLPPSPPLLPTDADASLLLPSTAFNPGRPSLARSNAALLPFTSFLSHLDTALTSLSLHTSARTDFITYWLPSFLRIHERGQHIAFRFLEQAAYEQSARLEVEPKPDVVTRVFLLFKGVKEEDSEGWRKAAEVDWVKEVGVEEDKFGDEKLFRVLEWGGMEVVA